MRTTQLVPTVTLDWLIGYFPMPDVIKIDVEAAELRVLRGGACLLDSRPTIICEVAGCNAATAANLLTAYGYTLYDADQPPSRRIPMTVAPSETLAICGNRS